MIVVKIELWPGGDRARTREIGRLYIANKGGTADRGDYNVAVCRRGSCRVPQELYTEEQRAAMPRYVESCPKATRSGEVLGYPRLAYSVWRLVARALRSCFPEES